MTNCAQNSRLNNTTSIKTVDTSTYNGHLQAQQLKKQGWVIVSIGLYTIQFVKAKNDKNNEKSSSLQ